MSATVVEPKLLIINAPPPDTVAFADVLDKLKDDISLATSIPLRLMRDREGYFPTAHELIATIKAKNINALLKWNPYNRTTRRRKKRLRKKLAKIRNKNWNWIGAP